MEKLNAAFHQRYPNVTLKRVSRSFDDLATTLRLAISGNEVPDVVQANNSRAEMGAFVAANQLLSLEPWAKVYGWHERYPASVSSTSATARTVSSSARATCTGCRRSARSSASTTTRPSWTASVSPYPPHGTTSRSRSARPRRPVPPDRARQPREMAALHVFGTVQDQLVPPDQVTTLAFGRSGASWNTPENLQVARKIADGSEPLLQRGVNGIANDPGLAGVLPRRVGLPHRRQLAGSDLRAAMGDKVRFIAPPPRAGRPVSATGGTGLPFAITSRAAQPDAAAAYLDYITNTDAMKVLTATGNLPVVDTAPSSLRTGSPGTCSPRSPPPPTGRASCCLYLDYATPTMSTRWAPRCRTCSAARRRPNSFLDTRAGRLRRVRREEWLTTSARVLRSWHPLAPTRRPRRRCGPAEGGATPPVWVPLAYLAPGSCCNAAFLLYPLGRAVHLSLFDWDGLTLAFVGLDNYVEVVTDEKLRARSATRWCSSCSSPGCPP